MECISSCSTATIRFWKQRSRNLEASSQSLNAGAFACKTQRRDRFHFIFPSPKMSKSRFVEQSTVLRRLFA